jgi:quercetin dioxygenase-like cupin family protein
MKSSSQSKARPDASSGWGTTAGVTTAWMADHDDGLRRGAAGIVSLVPGAEQPLHRHSGGEEVSIVLAGSGDFAVAGEWTAAADGIVLHAPPGSDHAVRAGAGGMTLLVLLGGAADSAATGWVETDPGAEPGAGAVVIDSRSRDEVIVDDAERGFHGMRTRWLIDADATPSDSLMVGRVTYSPGGVHALHKHPDADEFFFLVDGRGTHFGVAGEEIPAGPGEIAAMRADEWHGFRNEGGELVAIFGFLGAPNFASAGYVLAAAATR